MILQEGAFLARKQSHTHKEKKALREAREHFDPPRPGRGKCLLLISSFIEPAR